MVTPIREEEFALGDLFHNKSRVVKADFHNHWRTSAWVKSGDLRKAALSATHKNNLGHGAVIGLVNFEDSRYEETIDKSSKDLYVHALGANAVCIPSIGECMVVKGQEVPTAEGDVLFMGLDRDTYIQRGVPIRDRTLIDTLREGKEKGAIAILPHPFYKRGVFYSNSSEEVIARLGSTGLANLVFGYETFNSEVELSIPFVLPSGANQKAREEFTKEGGIKERFPHIEPIVSSDGHSFHELGSAYMRIPMPKSYAEMDSSEKVLGALKYAVKEANRRHLPVSAHPSFLPYGGAMHFLDLATLMANAMLAKKLPSPLAAPFASINNKMRRPDYNSQSQIH